MRVHFLTNLNSKNPEKMRMLWVCYSKILESHETLSGSERIERAQHLAEEGHDIYLLTAYFNKNNFQRQTRPNLHLISVPIKYKSFFSSILYGLVLLIFLPFYIVKIRPDVVISDHTTAPFLVWNPFFSRILKFKTILDIRSTPVGKGARVPFRSRFLFNSSVWVAKAFFNGITVVTPMMRDEVCRLFNINPKWTGILSNGISEKLFNPERKEYDKKKLKKQLGLSNKFVIIYHGSFRLTGGMLESIKAVANLKESYPDLVLFLLGLATKTFMKTLQQTIKDNNVEKNVILHGPVPFSEVPKFIAMSDLGLVPLPSNRFWRYQQPLKLLEYMAMSKTVIVSESPAHRSVINENKNAIYISEVSPYHIQKAIEYCYDYKDKLDEWGKVGREIVRKNYVWKRLNETFLSYIRSVKLGRNGCSKL